MFATSFTGVWQQLLLVAFLAALLLCALPANSQSAPFKACLGTQLGVIPDIHGSSSADRLSVYSDLYSNCTYVEYNLEIVGLDAAADLSFLSSITTIQGYLLVAGNQLQFVSIPNLLIIYGGDLFSGSAVYLSDNPALQELRLPELREVSKGFVAFPRNPSLCFVRYSVEWRALQQDTSGNNLTGAAPQSSCPGSCNGTYCWGNTTLQKSPFNYKGLPSCSAGSCTVATTRCVIGFTDRCCAEECAAGCSSGSSPSSCFACKQRPGLGSQRLSLDTSDSTCKAQDKCPSKRAAFMRCVPSCPEPLLYFEPANQCVRGCGIRDIDFQSRQCLTTSSSLKFCDFTSDSSAHGPLIHAGNIKALNGCQLVSGSILIHRISFTGYSGNGVTINPITVDDLEKYLGDIVTIQGFLAVVDVDAILPDLSFLATLTEIYGSHDSYQAFYSLYISGNSQLRSYNFPGLKSIQFGNIAVRNNPMLCSDIDWFHLVRKFSPRAAAVTVMDNQNQSVCANSALACDSQCNSTLGCLGARADQCLACQRYQYKGVCVAACNFNGSQCVRCDLNCVNDSCSGPTGANCSAGCVNLKQGNECVTTCTGSYYTAIASGPAGLSCQPCNRWCARDNNPDAVAIRPNYCTGPGVYVNSRINATLMSGCNYCPRVRVDGTADEIVCLSPDVQASPCGNGYYAGSIQLSDGSSDSLKAAACIKCHAECTSCTRGTNNATGCACRNVQEAGRCVGSCSLGYADARRRCTTQCHPECAGLGRCTGPNSTQCASCRNLQLNRGGGVTECLSSCPAGLPYHDGDDRICVGSCGADEFPASANGQCTGCHPQCRGGCTDGSVYTCAECAFFFDNATAACVSTCLPGTAVNASLDANTTCYVLPKNETEMPTQAASNDAAIIGAAAGGVVGGIVLIAVAVAIVYWRIHEKKRNELPETVVYAPDIEEIPELPFELSQVDASTLKIGINLGSGSFGTVYKAVWQPDDRTNKVPVALKALTDKSSLHPSKKAIMLDYLDLLAQMDHPHVVRTLCVNMDESVMIGYQFMPYGSLLLFMHQRRRYITSKALLTYCYQICDGMIYLMDQGLVHRNLRAANCLVHRPDQVQVGDAGLAEVVENGDQQLPVEWMAPESLQQGVFTFNSDVWSFGVTMWEILTIGSVPYVDRATQDLAKLLASGDRLKQPRTCTIDIYKLMLQCWIGEASGRPKFPELLENLEPMVEDSERYIILRPEELNEPSHPQQRRHRRRRDQSTTGTLVSVDGDDWFRDAAANYNDAYEDIDKLLTGADGLYEDPDVVAAGGARAADGETPYDNSMGVIQENPYDNSQANGQASNPYDNAMAMQAVGNGGKDVVAIPEGYTDIDTVPTSSVVAAAALRRSAKDARQLEDSTTFSNPAYMGMPEVVGQEQNTIVMTAPSAGAAGSRYSTPRPAEVQNVVPAASTTAARTEPAGYESIGPDDNMFHAGAALSTGPKVYMTMNVPSEAPNGYESIGDAVGMGSAGLDFSATYESMALGQDPSGYANIGPLAGEGVGADAGLSPPTGMGVMTSTSADFDDSPYSDPKMMANDWDNPAYGAAGPPPVK